MDEKQEVDLILKVNTCEQKIISLEHRMKDCEQQQAGFNDLVVSVKELATNMKFMADEQKIQGERLSALEREPIDNVRQTKMAIVKAVATAIASAVIGALITLVIV